MQPPPGLTAPLSWILARDPGERRSQSRGERGLCPYTPGTDETQKGHRQGRQRESMGALESEADKGRKGLEQPGGGPLDPIIWGGHTTPTAMSCQEPGQGQDLSCPVSIGSKKGEGPVGASCHTVPVPEPSWAEEKWKRGCGEISTGGGMATPWPALAPRAALCPAPSTPALQDPRGLGT